MLIKNGRIIDPINNTDEVTDLKIAGGEIIEIGRDLDTAGEDIIKADGLIVAPGFVDVHAHFRDPGQTEKETIHTGALAAAAGGYTSVICMANTIPAVDSKEVLKDILDRAAAEKVHIYQAAAVTKERKGHELVPMKELLSSGARGFTDDGTPIMDQDLVREAMVKAAELGTPLSFHEEDPRYVWEAGINSGKVAQSMGLKGADRAAETLMIKRDLQMALETGATVDIQHVSSKEGVQMIRTFKKSDDRGLIHAEATPHHFSLTESAVETKGTLAKVNPPLRVEADRRAVIDGIKDGTLDLIATDHAPHTAEEKNREFTKAPSGMIGLETALALGITNLVSREKLSLNKLIELMSVNPAKLYRLKAGSLGTGDIADIVIFDPGYSWTLKESDLHSKSKNSPFIGMPLKGRVKYTIAGGEIIYRL